MKIMKSMKGFVVMSCPLHYYLLLLLLLLLQGKVIKVLNLWQKSGIYSPEVIQPLLNLPSSLSEGKSDLKKIP